MAKAAKSPGSRKILVSPGFGAGWSTWNRENEKVAKFMLTYEPIIKFLEKGGKFPYESDDNALHPLLKRLRRECKKRFGADYVCVLGADDLKVVTVSGPVRLDEHDGNESFEEPGDFTDWM